MKVLIVCSGNIPDIHNKFQIYRTFIYEQVESLKKTGIEFEYYLINGKGLLSYLQNIFTLRNFIHRRRFDLIHAHYGLSGLVAIFQRKVPTLITFHGSDINIFLNNILSSIAGILAQYSIFVSQRLQKKIIVKPKYASIVPCGIELETFFFINQKIAKEKCSLNVNKKYILFTSNFKNKVKNYPLAKRAIELTKLDIELVELKNKSRKEVNLLLNACELLLMTSYSEGSPQIVKEAMAVNCPVVSTDVGEVSQIINDTNHCYVLPFDAKLIASKIIKILDNPVRTNGRNNISDYNNELIASKIKNIYHQVLN